MTSRHTFTLAVLAAVSTLSVAAVAQTYPSRPITMIVPTTAGTSADTLGRVLAERMRQSLGQPVVIENVSGADGTIGVARAARAQPDGYTIYIGYKATILNGAFYSLAYDVLNDFAPIAPLATTPWVLFARTDMPAKSLSELIAWLKANPNRASAGISAASGRLITAFFQKETGTQLTLVPYRGGAQVVQDLAAGQIDLGFQTPDQLPLMRASAVKAYAVTSSGRLTIASDIPTFEEMGWPGISYTGWYGLFARSGTPRETVSRLNAAAMDALSDSLVRSRLTALGMEPFPRDQQTPEALGALVKTEAEKWWPIIKELGLKAE